MLYTKFQDIGLLVVAKFFLKVITIYGRGSHLGHHDLDHLNKLSFPLPMEAPHEIWLKLVKRFRRISLKMVDDKRRRRTDAGVWVHVYYKLTL